ncbi:hypothetical protein [Azospirillum brasilense]|uniref:hypothetical protein n=1 Tax=Azospirillum brasilense TaxID=192 RepID=UPI001EDBC4AD|nr:hypothetical protein [Azospirillum brasilense]UKJ74529.1 hypothetical protein H1Q64_18395 [Azospirillum brasilense]
MAHVSYLNLPRCAEVSFWVQGGLPMCKAGQKAGPYGDVFPRIINDAGDDAGALQQAADLALSILRGGFAERMRDDARFRAAGNGQPSDVAIPTDALRIAAPGLDIAGWRDAESVFIAVGGKAYRLSNLDHFALGSDEEAAYTIKAAASLIWSVYAIKRAQPR